MRKYVVGGLVGFLLAIPFTSFGAEIQSIVGKKVLAEYDVVVDGQQLNKKAIAIDGTTYAPLRSIGEATGYDVAFESKTVTFEAQTIEPTTGATVEPTPTPEPTPSNQPIEGGVAVPTTQPDLTQQISDLDRQIRKLIQERDYIAAINGLDKPLSVEDKKKVDDLNARIVDLQAKKVALQAQLQAQP